MEAISLVPQKEKGWMANKYMLGGVVFTVVVLVTIAVSVGLSYQHAEKPTQVGTSRPPTPVEHDNEKRGIIWTNDTTPIGATTYQIPCVYNANTPAGCTTERVRTVTCGTVNSNGYPTVLVGTSTGCEKEKVTLQQWINVQFYQNPGTTNCLEITMRVGECWGKNPINSGTYSCQGECGAGCINGCGIFSLGGGWSRNCLRHDICSWYFGAAGGGSDKYCGGAYKLADGDIFNCNCDIKTTHTCDF